MSQRASFRSQVLIAAAVAAAVSGTASAQAQLEEIIVTARRTAESLQETPISVTAFTAESIERRGIRNVQAVLISWFHNLVSANSMLTQCCVKM